MYRLIPYSEVIYCSAPDMLIYYLERVKLSVMQRQWTAGLVVSSELLPEVSGLQIESLAVFRSSTFSADELDQLYSELALLPL